METELWLVTVPFQKWVEGDALPLLESFPLMVLAVCSAPKPQVRKFMLLQLEKLLYYKEYHPDFLEFMGQNCARADEEDIELFNALLGRFCKARQVVEIGTYVHISGMITGIHKLSRELDNVALSGRGRGTGRGAERAEDASEHLRLRGLYATASWVETNARLDEWILGRLQTALAGDPALDAAWPREDRFKDALAQMPKWQLQLDSWLASIRRREKAVDAADVGAQGDGADGDDAETAVGTAAEHRHLVERKFVRFLAKRGTPHSHLQAICRDYGKAANLAAPILRELVAEVFFERVGAYF